MCWLRWPVLSEAFGVSCCLFLRGSIRISDTFCNFTASLTVRTEPWSEIGRKREKKLTQILLNGLTAKLKIGLVHNPIAVTMQAETERTLPENQTQTRQKTNPKTNKTFLNQPAAQHSKMRHHALVLLDLQHRHHLRSHKIFHPCLCLHQVGIHHHHLIFFFFV